MAGRVIGFFTLLAIVCSSLTGCRPFTPDVGGEIVRSTQPRDENPDVEEAELKRLVQGNSEFALDLFRVLRAEEGNLFFSPYSISMALAMVYAGARGDTAEAMEQTMHFALGQERLHLAFNALALDLAHRAERSEGDFRLTVANSSWGQRGYLFRPDFLDVLSGHYGAGVHMVDFAKSPEACRRLINGWVSEETNRRIRELIAPGMITPLTRLVLANAIYLKALWPVPFDERRTAPRPFRLLDGGEVRVPTMEKSLVTSYAHGDGYEAVWLSLSYQSKCGVLIIVPDMGRFDEIEGSLDSAALGSISRSFDTYDVHLFLPKFSYSSSFELAKALTSLGMGNAFGPEADYSGMDGSRELSIADVVHEAFVAVDEFGIEAGGATAPILATSPPPPPPVELRVDRPFIFLIQDWNGTILFMGRVLDPR